MGHLVRRASLLDCRRRVTTANDRGRASSRALDQYLNEGIRTFGEGWHLCYSERAVPYNGLRSFKDLTESCDGCRANIQDAPSRGDLVRGNNFRGCIGSKA